ncbi:kell blood group glycoprotein isoform X2 [Erpetoichthys calabaricus]|uniref:kell blood group glycoprotein isoform X2 n=1 Tax=Erpetoichthys calabaricus TaxID=27687 RepID=UPI002234D7E6|nr:kell blood group glycoprotein isoform X2 [Erpetoichthys calabaricus]
MAAELKLVDNGTAEQLCLQEKAPSRPRSWHVSRKRFVVILATFTCIAVVGSLTIILLKMNRHSTGGLPILPAWIFSTINSTKDPCEDILGFSCGQQLNITKMKIHSKSPNPGQQQIFEILRSSLENSSTNLSSAEEKAKKFYYVCSNLSQIIATGRLAFRETIKKIGLTNSTNINAVLQKIMKDYNTYPFFKLNLVFDPQNTSKYAIQIDRPEFHFEPDIKFLGVSEGETMKIAGPVLAITSVLRSMASKKETDNPFFQRITISELQRNAPGINWLECLQATFESISMKPSDHVYVHDLPYLTNMSKYISEYHKISVLNFYMIASFFQTVSPALDPRFTQAKRKITKTSDKSKEEPTPPWKKCVFDTHNAFGPVVEAMFIQDSISEKKQKMVTELVNEIRSALQTMIVNNQLTSEKTRKATLERLKSITVHLDQQTSAEELNVMDTLYSEFIVTDSYFESYLQYLKFAKKWKMERMKTTSWQNSSLGSPLSTVPYRSHEKKIIYFPAGMFQEPLFGEDYPRAVYYGGIGTVIAEELIIMLADFENGLSSWSASQEFLNCLQVQLQNDTIHIDSHKTWAERKGMEVAYHAYESRLNTDWCESSLANLESLTKRQMFFVTYAQIICETSGKASAVEAEFRVKGLYNSFLFQREFGCSAKSSRNPYGEMQHLNSTISAECFHY